MLPADQQEKDYGRTDSRAHQLNATSGHYAELLRLPCSHLLRRHDGHRCHSLTEGMNDLETHADPCAAHRDTDSRPCGMSALPVERKSIQGTRVSA